MLFIIYRMIYPSTSTSHKQRQCLRYLSALFLPLYLREEFSISVILAYSDLKYFTIQYYFKRMEGLL